MDDPQYLIRKGGYYYRSDAAGYTLSKAEAGRYTLADAVAYSHPNGPDGPRDGITYELDDITAQGDDVERLLGRITCTAETSARVMRDAKNTGGWWGAENTAKNFDIIAKQTDDLRAALAVMQQQAFCNHENAESVVKIAERSQPQPDAAVAVERERCAKIAEKRAEDRFAENGTTEPDTNASYYSGRCAELYDSLDEEDWAIAAAIRAGGQQS